MSEFIYGCIKSGTVARGFGEVPVAGLGHGFRDATVSSGEMTEQSIARDAGPKSLGQIVLTSRGGRPKPDSKVSQAGRDGMISRPARGTVVWCASLPTEAFFAGGVT